MGLLRRGTAGSSNPNSSDISLDLSKILRANLDFEKVTSHHMLLITQSAKNKTLAYEKANTILKYVELYMMTSKLHIQMSKSCFIDFKSEKNSALPNEELKVLIQNIEI